MRAPTPVIVVLLLLPAASCRRKDDAGEAPRHPLGAEQQKQLAERIARSRQAIEEADRPWRSAVEAMDPRRIKGAPACGPLTPFRTSLEANPQGSTFGRWRLLDVPLSAKAGSSSSLTRTPFPLRMARGTEPIPAHSPEAAIRLRELDELQRSAGVATVQPFESRLKDATIEKLYATDVLLVLDDVKEPGVSSDRAYTPGSIVARAWVFDHQQNQLVCAGVVTAASSPTVDTGSSNLNDDLLINLVRALPDSVHELGQ